VICEISFAEAKKTLTVTMLYFLLQNERLSLAGSIKLNNIVWNVVYQ